MRHDTLLASIARCATGLAVKILLESIMQFLGLRHGRKTALPLGWRPGHRRGLQDMRCIVTHNGLDAILASYRIRASIALGKALSVGRNARRTPQHRCAA